jgi:hypothetical protein
LSGAFPARHGGAYSSYIHNDVVASGTMLGYDRQGNLLHGLEGGYAVDGLGSVAERGALVVAAIPA